MRKFTNSRAVNIEVNERMAKDATRNSSKPLTWSAVEPYVLIAGVVAVAIAVVYNVCTFGVGV